MAMMSLSSCTTLLMSRAASPAPRPTPGKSSSGAGSLQLLRSRQPPAAAASSVEALRRASSYKQESRPSRAAVFACHALNKYSYHIDPTALVHRPTTTTTSAGTNWRISEDKDKDLIVLELEVGEVAQEKLEVSTRDHVLLVVRYTGDINDEWRASSLDVRLLMPPGCDEKNVGAVMVSKGWLMITIPKPKHEPNKIQISASP